MTNWEAFDELFSRLKFDNHPPTKGQRIDTAEGTWTWDGEDWVHPEGKLLPWQKHH